MPGNLLASHLRGGKVWPHISRAAARGTLCSAAVDILVQCAL